MGGSGYMIRDHVWIVIRRAKRSRKGWGGTGVRAREKTRQNRETDRKDRHGSFGQTGNKEDGRGELTKLFGRLASEAERRLEGLLNETTR